MSKIQDFAFEDIMHTAVVLFGHDENMEECKNIAELSENIGQEQIDRIVQELDQQ